MPELLKAAILGIVQGLTEFLPVSSTGHLVLFEEALDIDQKTFGLTFDAAIHLGTLLSILFLLRQDIRRLATGWLRSLRPAGWASIRTLAPRPNADSPLAKAEGGQTHLPDEQARLLDDNEDGRLAWLIILGTVPAAILGLLLESAVEDSLRKPLVVACMAISFAVVLALAERLGTKTRLMTHLGAPGALFIGFAQAVALVPGVSRSGITISAGLFAGLERRQAAVFAFLLSAPVVAGAGLKKVYDVFDEVRTGTLDAGDLGFFAVGFALSALAGALAIAFLLRFLQRNPLYVFVWYRVLLGLMIFGVLAAT
jgi:undecaprenyl-diphosphatase